ncbi:MAG TPA: EamA family transporter, partial [Stellaceae bacterium]|nr:EamA family transporter [Stellaceae bacterium]
MMPPRNSPTMGTTEWALLLALALAWSATFLFSKIALMELPPLTVVLGRVGFAAIALNLVMVAAGQRWPGDG